MAKDKILFVISLYGTDVSGGGEWHCRQLAERLTPYFDVEVATTKAREFTTWRNFYTEDSEIINGVKVHRFATDRERDIGHGYTEQLVRSDPYDHALSMRWLVEQGPYSEGLTEFLENSHQNYRKVIVFQYLYATTYFAVDKVPAEKLVLVPLAHDEPIIKFPIFEQIFKKPEWLVFNSEVEYEVVHKNHFIMDKNYVVAGAGVDLPSNIDPNEFKQKFNIENYIVFVGRIEPSKRVDVLVEDFIKYKEKYPSDLKLVLIGKKIKQIKQHPDIIETGQLDENLKFSALKGALALVNPSAFESLSLIVLESFFVKKPVIVNGSCEVLRRHAQESNGGLWYETSQEFNEVINYLLQNSAIASDMGGNGYKYVENKYTWKIVIEKWLKVLNS